MRLTSFTINFTKSAQKPYPSNISRSNKYPNWFIREVKQAIRVEENCRARLKKSSLPHLRTEYRDLREKRKQLVDKGCLPGVCRGCGAWNEGWTANLKETTASPKRSHKTSALVPAGKQTVRSVERGVLACVWMCFKCTPRVKFGSLTIFALHIIDLPNILRNLVHWSKENHLSLNINECLTLTFTHSKNPKETTYLPHRRAATWESGPSQEFRSVYT